MQKASANARRGPMCKIMHIVSDMHTEFRSVLLREELGKSNEIRSKLQSLNNYVGNPGPICDDKIWNNPVLSTLGFGSLTGLCYGATVKFGGSVCFGSTIACGTLAGSVFLGRCCDDIRQLSIMSSRGSYHNTMVPEPGIVRGPMARQGGGPDAQQMYRV